MDKKEIFNIKTLSLTADYVSKLVKEFDTINHTCTIMCLNHKLNILNHKISKWNSTEFTGYFKCKGDKCRRYKFVIIDLTSIENCNVTVHLYSTTEEITHKQKGKIGMKYRRPIRQGNRKEIAEILQHTGSMNYQIEKWKDLGETEEKFGKFSSVPTTNVLNTISSEYRRKKMFDPDEVVDLNLLRIKMAEEDKKSKLLKGNIRAISSYPFNVVLYSEEQLNIFVKLAKEQNLVLFIDATGSFLQNIKREHPKKRILFYSVVAKGVNLSTPIASFIAEEHSSPEIKKFLEKLIYDSRNIGKSCGRCTIVNIDNSRALLNSVLHSFNIETVTDYVNKCWVKQCKEDYLYDKTIVHWCSAHFMHQITKNAKKLASDDSISIIQSITSLIISSVTLQEQECLMKIFFTLLDNNFANKRHDKVLQQLKDMACANQNEDFNPTSDFEGIEEIEKDDAAYDASNENKTIKENSPYFQHFLKIRHDIDVELQKETKTQNYNKFYSPKFVYYYMNNVVPYVCFWSATFISKGPPILSSIEKKRLTNATIESSFRDVKHTIFKSKKNIKIRDAIQVLHTQYGGKARKFNFDIMYPLTRKIKRENKNIEKKRVIEKEEIKNEDMTLSDLSKTEETWGKFNSQKKPLAIEKLINLSMESGKSINAFEKGKCKEPKESWIKRKRLNSKQKIMKKSKENQKYFKSLLKVSSEQKKVKTKETKKLDNKPQINKTRISPQSKCQKQSLRKLNFEPDFDFKVFDKNTTSTPRKTIKRKIEANNKMKIERELKIKNNFDSGIWISDIYIEESIQMYLNNKKENDEQEFDTNLNEEDLGIALVPVSYFQILCNKIKAGTLSDLDNHNYLNKEKLLCPMNTDLKGKGYHWLLLEILLDQKLINVYNSSINTTFKDETNIKAVSNFLIAIYALAGLECNIEEFTINNITDTPQQQDAYNCGIAVIANARSIINKEPFIKANLLDKERVKIMKKLIKYRPTQNNSNENKKEKEFYEKKEAVCAKVMKLEHKFKNNEGIRELDTTNNNFSICEANECRGNANDEQIKCVKCRRWLHYVCEELSEVAAKIQYYICKICNLL